MKIDLSAARAKEAVRPRECFELGQRVTEVASALAYANYFARWLSTERTTARHVSAGVQTAANAAARLRDAVAGQTKKKAGRLESSLRSLNETLRSTWIEVGAGRQPAPGDVVEVQRRISDLRRTSMEIWADARLSCPNGPDARRKGRKR